MARRCEQTKIGHFSVSVTPYGHEATSRHISTETAKRGEPGGPSSWRMRKRALRSSGASLLRCARATRNIGWGGRFGRAIDAPFSACHISDDQKTITISITGFVMLL